MLELIQNNKIVKIIIFILTLPIICFILNFIINIIFKGGQIVGQYIHNFIC